MARREPSRAAIAALTFGAVSVVAIVDFVLVDVDTVSHLYYLPILLAATQLGLGCGIGVAAVAALLTHLADPQLSHFHYGEADVMELLLFLTVALVSSRLAQNARQLRRLATTDDLTGLSNLRSFEAVSRALIERGRMQSSTVAMLCLDVDRLKQLNDTYGHLTGADAVRHVGKLIAEQLPEDSQACRYGGDEFAIVLGTGGTARATLLARRIQEAVAASAPVLDGKPFFPGTLAVSVGCAADCLGREDVTAEVFTRLFRQADAAMYADKRQRRARSNAAQSNVVGLEPAWSDFNRGVAAFRTSSLVDLQRGCSETATDLLPG
ncbi:MAG TPA: diguanylate cyclase, partial [Polyangiaceae bacterium]|nr:diguanylate cyclase [Polyangiaceae bacterium]